MEVNIPSLGKVTVLGDGPNNTVKIKLGDGRETYWPKAKLPQPEGTETLKVVKIPAIERLEELLTERDRLEYSGIPVPGDGLLNLITELRGQALIEFKEKWGLT